LAREKTTSYITSELADAVRRVAAIEDRSISDIVEDALAHYFRETGRAAEHAALMARLDVIVRRLAVIERGQETHFELTAQATRFAMSVAPEISDADRSYLSARGADRFNNLMSAVTARLSAGRSTWRDTLATSASVARSTEPPAAAQSEPSSPARQDVRFVRQAETAGGTSAQ
jgi:hypothetical protein